MLRVTVELVPNGREDRSRTLGRMEIENVDNESLFTGAYRIVMHEFNARSHDQQTTFRTVATLENVERDLIRPMQLASMALSVVAPVKRTMHSSPEGPLGVVLTQEEV